MENQIETSKFIPEKAKQIALARLDLVHKWLEFRRKSNIKIQADYDFVKLHNTTDSHLRQVLGKVSRGSLHRWNAIELYPKKWTTKSCEYGIRKRKGTEKWKNLQKKKKNY